MEGLLLEVRGFKDINESVFGQISKRYVEEWVPRFLALRGSNTHIFSPFSLEAALDGETSFELHDRMGRRKINGYNINLARETLKEAFINGPAALSPEPHWERG